MSKSYYMVQVKYPDAEDWEDHFGDYNRRVAQEEVKDVRYENQTRNKEDRVLVRMVESVVSDEQYAIDMEGRSE